MNEAEHKIKNIIVRQLVAQKEAGIVWTLLLIVAAFTLGTFLGRLAL